MAMTGAGLYRITNTVNGKFYIGSSVKIPYRLADHRCALRAGRHGNRHLQSSWDKHGESAFSFSALVILEKDEIREAEKRLLDIVVGQADCYNVSRDTCGGWTGMKLSDEHRRKMSESHKKRVFSEEHMANFERARARLTPESRRRGADKLRGRKGKPASAETRAKLSAAHLGKPHPHTPEWTAKIAAKLRGKPWSPARRAAYDNRSAK